MPALESLTIDSTHEHAGNRQLELVGGPYDVVAFRTPTPGIDPRWTQATDADGDRLAGIRYQNRQISITVEIVPSGIDAAADAQAALAALADKLAKVNREGGTLRRTLPGGDAVTFDLIAADAVDLSWSVEWETGRIIRVELGFTAKPFARGDEESRSAHSESTLPVLAFAETDIAGDVPALGRLVVTDGGVASQAWCQWGLQAATYDAAATAGLYYEAESRTPLGSAAIATQAGASGGGSNNVLSSPLSASWQAVLSTQAAGGGAHLTHVGEYRVFARLHRPASNSGQVAVALEWALGDFLSFTRNAAVYYAVDEFADVFTIADLGTIDIPRSATRWEGHVVASSSAYSDALKIDCLWLVPLERSGEASALQAVPTPTAFAARDEFTASSNVNLTGGMTTNGVAGATNASPIVITSNSHGLSNGAKVWIEGVGGNTAANGYWTVANQATNTFELAGSTGNGTYTSGGTIAKAGRTPLVGGGWHGAGDPDDFTVDATNDIAVRSALSDGATPRIAIVPSAALTGVHVQVNARSTDLTLVDMGIVARYVNASNYLYAWMQFGDLSLRKVVAGTGTFMKLTHSGVTSVLNWFTIGMRVLESGHWELLADPAGSGRLDAPLAQGWDADLAPGGALASGCVGLYDRYAGAIPAHSRHYDGFAAWSLPADAAIFAGRELEVRHDGVAREDAAGTALGRLATYEGDLLTIPSSGPEERTARFVVKTSRSLPGTGPDAAIDDVSAQLHVTPRYLIVP